MVPTLSITEMVLLANGEIEGFSGGSRRNSDRGSTLQFWAWWAWLA